ncbi:aa3-type cytochrome c oxidase subunit IV [Sphingomonas daechungensis]|uniref:Aa3-type cytochrome c oxidase subunit IV n=1 Tax=Sphingomonas daechungensis TaxID=1176646 RepID=A0ABX6T446_9SPHN|nr:aa3-type cytochrome c oxidase subunit IV [Sphingomonas daechungensis]
MAHHVRDYEGFIRLFKWGAIICLIIAFLVIQIIT